MADLNEDEQIRLLFKQGGLDIVTDAKESFHNLTEEMKETAKAADKVQEATKTVDTTVEQAKQVLADTSTVVADLKAKIASLTGQQNDLAESFRSGLIPSASQFKEQYDNLGSEISRNQSILEAATGTGDGESGKGGFAGLAGGAIKAEKAISAIATGHGLGRLGGLLESLVGLIGGPAGAGLAAGGLLFAIEGLLPKLTTWAEKMTGVAEAHERATKALKEHAEAMKKDEEAARKLIEEPTEEEAADRKAVRALLGEGKARDIKTGIAAGLEAQKFGLTREEDIELEYNKKLVGRMQTEGRTSAAGWDISHYVGRIRELQEKRGGAIEEEANRMLRLLPESEEVQKAVGAMPQVPEKFRRGLETARSAETQSEKWDRKFVESEEKRVDQEIKQAAQEELREALADQKKEEAGEKWDRAFVHSEEDRVARENTQTAQEELRSAQARQRRDEIEARQAKTKADREARENISEASNRRAASAKQNEAMAEAQRQNQLRVQMGGTAHPAFDPAELQQVVGMVGRNRMMNSSLGYTLAQQVDFFMGQLEQKMVADFARGMEQQLRSYQNMGAR